MLTQIRGYESHILVRPTRRPTARACDAGRSPPPPPPPIPLMWAAFQELRQKMEVNRGVYRDLIRRMEELDAQKAPFQERIQAAQVAIDQLKANAEALSAEQENIISELGKAESVKKRADTERAKAEQQLATLDQRLQRAQRELEAAIAEATRRMPERIHVEETAQYLMDMAQQLEKRLQEQQRTHGRLEEAAMELEDRIAKYKAVKADFKAVHALKIVRAARPTRPTSGRAQCRAVGDSPVALPRPRRSAWPVHRSSRRRWRCG